MLAKTIHNHGYDLSISDPDTFLVIAISTNCDKYSTYVIIYVDVILNVHHNNKQFMS